MPPMQHLRAATIQRLLWKRRVKLVERKRLPVIETPKTFCFPPGVFASLRLTAGWASWVDEGYDERAGNILRSLFEQQTQGRIIAARLAALALRHNKE